MMSPLSRTLMLFVASFVAALPAASSGNICTVSQFSSLANAVSSCKYLTISNLAVPGGSTLDLSGLQDGATVTFAGKTTFAFKSADYDMIKIGGKGITITAEQGAIIDGNGSAWWDGKGSNGGSKKPNRFIAVHGVSGKSTIENLHIQNWPVHCFSINGCEELKVQNIILDNSAGNEPNGRSGGKAAAHNTDGFDISSSSNTILSNSHVVNQDDCVAITSGNNITVSSMNCVGGHGLSIGSIGGKSDNTVQNVRFENSFIGDSQNGVRIKTNSGATGTVEGITYSNITLSNISNYGLVIQQDYLNGGPTGNPTNGVKIDRLAMSGITGNVRGGRDYYILCGEGSCSDFTLDDINIEGGSGDSCNYHPQGNFKC